MRKKTSEKSGMVDLLLGRVSLRPATAVFVSLDAIAW